MQALKFIVLVAAMLPIISALASDAGASTDASQEPHQPEPAPLSALPNLLPRGTFGGVPAA